LRSGTKGDTPEGLLEVPSVDAQLVVPVGDNVPFSSSEGRGSGSKFRSVIVCHTPEGNVGKSANSTMSKRASTPVQLLHERQEHLLTVLDDVLALMSINVDTLLTGLEAEAETVKPARGSLVANTCFLVRLDVESREDFWVESLLEREDSHLLNKASV
jgi:hypothetical protein